MTDWRRLGCDFVHKVAARDGIGVAGRNHRWFFIAAHVSRELATWMEWAATRHGTNSRHLARYCIQRQARVCIQGAHRLDESARVGMLWRSDQCGRRSPLNDL